MKMENLKIYEKGRSVPKEAQKEIKGGRLSGKTDINPMWRIKTLTEQFGPVGFGWRYEILEERLEPAANGEIAAFVKINLYVCIGEKWSAAIPGTGGNMFVSKESGGLHTSDECFKMALTDALSVACKALGIGADVYWNADSTKYTDAKTESKKAPADKKAETPKIEDKGETKKDLHKEIARMIIEMYGKEKAAEKLYEFTKFTADGKEVPGVSELKLLKDKRLYAAYGKIKTEYIKWTESKQKVAS